MVTAEAEKRIELPDTPEIRRQYAYLLHMKERVVMAENALKEMVESFRLHCDHDFEEVKKEGNLKGFYDDPFGEPVVIGLKCRKCFIFKPRSGIDFQDICQKCGGKMKYDKTARGQDGQTFTYVCEDCKHIYIHT